MDDLSVSKGVFAHCKRRVGEKPKKRKSEVKLCLEHKSEPWYQAYKEISLAIDNAAAKENADTFKKLLCDMKEFVSKIKLMPLLMDEIPTGILLAGVNLPDHDVLLQKLVHELEPVTPYIATVWSRDACTLKNLIEEVVYQIINHSNVEEHSEVKKTHSNFCALSAWHSDTNNGDTPLVIIIPDFESFCPSVLHDFILILSSYMHTIKFVLIFGVATTLHVVHRSLSYDATSKLKCQVFQTQKQSERLSDVLEAIIMAEDIPFKITGRAFSLLVDIFLWYDFSVDGFLKSYKICLWKHFYNVNENTLCCNKEDISDRVANLTSADFKRLRKLPSVKEYLKTLSTSKEKISDVRFKEIVMNLLEDFHDYMDRFLVILQCLFKASLCLGNDLFGKSFQSIYTRAISKDICETEEYKKVMQMISFLSREELLNCIKIIRNELILWEEAPQEIDDCLEKHFDTLKTASDVEIEEELKDNFDMSKVTNRLQWRQQLAQKSKEVKKSEYKKASADFIQYIDKEVFRKYLIHPSKVPLHEIFCFSDSNTVNRNIKGSTKASIYNCLNNPHDVFDMDCCTGDRKSIAKHPDINIVYALLLENRRMVNMYDWLQSYVTIVDPNFNSDDTEDTKEIDPVLHARFTRSVAELQFLGFIKATRKKTDHVKRLTV